MFRKKIIAILTVVTFSVFIYADEVKSDEGKVKAKEKGGIETSFLIDELSVNVDMTNENVDEIEVSVEEMKFTVKAEVSDMLTISPYASSNFSFSISDYDDEAMVFLNNFDFAYGVDFSIAALDVLGLMFGLSNGFSFSPVEKPVIDVELSIEAELELADGMAEISLENVVDFSFQKEDDDYCAKNLMNEFTLNIQIKPVDLVLLEFENVLELEFSDIADERAETELNNEFVFTFEVKPVDIFSFYVDLGVNYEMEFDKNGKSGDDKVVSLIPEIGFDLSPAKFFTFSTGVYFENILNFSKNGFDKESSETLIGLDLGVKFKHKNMKFGINYEPVVLTLVNGIKQDDFVHAFSMEYTLSF